MLGTWVEWLTKEMNTMIDLHLSRLPAKSKKIVPYIYWLSAPTHSCFTPETNRLRIKFNLSLDAVIHAVKQDNMRVIRIQEPWDSKDSKLVINGRFTDLGLTTYWLAVDASFKYNASWREVYLAKQLASKDLSHHSNRDLPDRSTSSKTSSIKLPGTANEHTSAHGGCHDPMRSFFRRHSAHEKCHMDVCEDQRSGRLHEHRHNDRFILPQLKYH